MRPSIYFIFLTFLLLFTVNNHVLAETKEKVQFKDVTLTTSDSHLLLFALLDDNKQLELEEALHSGIPMQFTFLVELIHIRKNWANEELSNLEFVHTLKYDALKEQYQLQLDEQRNRTVTFTDLTEAMKMMDEINGLKVVELSKLTPDSSYELRMKAALYKKTLPMNLHYVIPFISLGNVETDWHSIEFTY
jgi:Domain of unknown function (DUF4390)